MVITPVADMAPRIIWLFDFPVDALLGDAIRVVAIKRRGVDKFRNNVFGKLWVAKR